MKLMVLGGGGREHAIIKKLRENPKAETIFALPGNGGISYDAQCENINALDLDRVVDFALANKVDFAVVAPDDPLAKGAVNRLLEVGIPAFGPTAEAAAIESSKVFAKELMRKYMIPTAEYRVFDSAADAIAYVETADRFPVVVKADGLALGKGVIIAENLDDAVSAIHRIMTERVFGDSGNRIVIEEFLTGPEVTILAFTDSKTLVPMVSSMDHKRVFDGDSGPNTGGMGTIASNPFYTDKIARRCMKEIFLPTINAMHAEGRPFKGCLYFGLMLTESGPKVIEYNSRFGDPEAQVVLPLLETDLLTIMEAVVEERLSEIPVTFRKGAACCVVAASKGYPGKYETNLPISGLTEGQLEAKGQPGPVSVFHAGTKRIGEGLVTAGGRVLGVTAVGDTLQQAVDQAYAAMEKIHFDGMHYRRDIGKKALLSTRP
ncbi:MAG: phosphoribosylamine--glycine ligase [Bacillota bacterium]|jgi:phosphoribosylamine--glycine ligase|nr:phosphoribosylamine--glycine ligase [Bacillota bacterium]